MLTIEPFNMLEAWSLKQNPDRTLKRRMGEVLSMRRNFSKFSQSIALSSLAFSLGKMAIKAS